MVIGVFESMRNENKDLISSGKVIITQSSFWSDDKRFENSCIVNNDNDYCYLCTSNKENSNLIIRFINNPISIQGIKLVSVDKTYAPISWSLEGSNDNESYEPIFSISEPICDKFFQTDKRECDGKFTKIYNIKKTKQFEYFKITQRGTNTAIYSTRSNRQIYFYSLRLSSIELYSMQPIQNYLTNTYSQHFYISKSNLFIFILD